MILKEFAGTTMPEEDFLQKKLQEARLQLASRQLAIKEAKLPVIVLMEGWGAAGKGSLLGKVIHNMDPRFYQVYNMDVATEEELRRPFLYRFFKRIPMQGQFAFYDGGWMDAATRPYLHGDIDKKEYRALMNSNQRFERQLMDNGYLVVKFFFHIDKKEQRKRLENLGSDKSTAWRVTQNDVWQNKYYKECMKVYDDYLDETNSKEMPWHIIDSTHKKWAELQMLVTLVASIDMALEVQNSTPAIQRNPFVMKPLPPLREINLDKKLSEKEYRDQLKKCQKHLKKLHNELYRRKIPVIIAYEGWDAAGKGGNIKRVASALDARGCDVYPIASPEPGEKARHYLWRFWTRLPKTGHIAIFDRTWYGRVMVERLEGFCSENDWQRAYHEINEFEKELTDWGAIVIKFWVQIDKDTQLERFTLRQNTPEKQWKITDEDWRNREKWDLYEAAVDEMIAKTSTKFAPWHILESNDKKFARIKALETIIKEIEKRL